MPYFSIQTNKSLDPSATADLIQKASALAADLLGKPEAYVMTAVASGTAMTFAGNDALAAFVEVKSVDLPEAECATYAARISVFLQTELGIEPGRVFIDLKDLPRTHFAWNGKTFG